jgi:U4/U6.U5 tri-snRNP-associated protein 3
MAEPPAKRARRTDSAAMWEKNESTVASTPKRPSEDSRNSHYKDPERESLNDSKDKRRNDERKDDRRRRSRSRDRYQSRKGKSRSRERQPKGRDRDRDRDRDRMRDDRRDRDRVRDRDHGGNRRDSERSRSPDRYRSSKGRFAVSPEYSYSSD